VQAYADDWEVLRREYLERPWDPAHLPAPLADRLRSRETLASGSEDSRTTGCG
jgi:UDP-galactopyranose mutase